MILLDTHIWIWWLDDNPKLTETAKEFLKQNESQGFAISIISCWEVAKLVEIGKLTLGLSVEDWLQLALSFPNIELLNLSIPIIIKSTQLTGFHKDPADQIIVATSQIYNIPLLTFDKKIIDYSEVNTIKL